MESTPYDIVNSVLLSEKSYFMTSYIKQLINTIPVVIKKDIVEQAQPGDILLAYTPRKLITNKKLYQIRSKLMASAQGTPYTSSKLIISNQEIIGYGIPSKFHKNKNAGINTYNLKNYLLMLQEACLLRVEGLTSNQAQKMIQYMKMKSNNDYDYIGLIKQLWNRLIRLNSLQFKIVDDHNIKEITEPLICSSIIGYAMKYAGVNIKFQPQLKNLWPRDFLLHPKIQKIARIQY